MPPFRSRAIGLVALGLMAGCADGSGTYALANGCYYASADGPAVLMIEDERGTIMTSGSSIDRVRVRPRVNEYGAYLEVSPGFHLETPRLQAAPSGATSARFHIEPRGGDSSISVPLRNGGNVHLTLGRACGSG